MQISTKDWLNYINKLSSLNNTAGSLMRDYVAKHGFSDTKAIIDYAYALVTKYGEGSAALSAEMYDSVAEMSGKILPAAEVAETASYGEIAKAVNGTLKTSKNPESFANIANRYTKRAGADTTLRNAKRDGAEFAWIPMGETCAFCLTLASRGWQHMSKSAMKGGHAEHIHAHCDCAYSIRFDSKSGVKGYDPDKYLAMYNNAEGDTPQEKINSMRRMQYEDPAVRNKIRAQKREAYAEKKALDNVQQTTYNRPILGKNVVFKTGRMSQEEYFEYKREIEAARNIPTVKLDAKEYQMVKSAFNQYIYNATDTEIQKHGIVSKEVQNHMYTAVNNGFDNYRFIGKEELK